MSHGLQRTLPIGKRLKYLLEQCHFLVFILRVVDRKHFFNTQFSYENINFLLDQFNFCWVAVTGLLDACVAEFPCINLIGKKRMSISFRSLTVYCLKSAQRPDLYEKS